MSICIANYRVSALYRYRREVLSMDEAEARAEMEQVWQPKGVWAGFVGRETAAQPDRLPDPSDRPKFRPVADFYTGRLERVS